ncbi:MAG TPA: glycosyltransferase [Propionibacteriaceae bacterium]|nr:glycosyltransferase [Propionibacteriaceae bacterium]
MRVAIVSTYPPRACGIAVFSADLREALCHSDSSTSVDIVSIVRDEVVTHPHEVIRTIRQDVLSDYEAAARQLAESDVDVVLVEHEYGIFGGDAGEFVVTLAQELTVPLVVTLHTVLSDPSPQQAETLRALCAEATLVTVFTETASRMVTEAGLVDPELVRVVSHGAPELLTLAASPMAGETTTSGIAHLLHDIGEDTRRTLDHLSGKTVLATFGLISASKGLEQVVHALPTIVARHPDVVYLIAGQTHPEVIKHEGESYRLCLERLVRDLDLTDHVHFLDRFLSEAELAVLLTKTKLYLTPYRSREQIVSGALTFAVAAGCPVVSTPYFYAEDLLNSGGGVLVPFGDPGAWATAVIDLLNSPAKLAEAAAEARRVGADLSWPSVGKATLEVLAEAVHRAGEAADLVGSAGLPQIRPDHLLALVDDVGIVQHARGVVPDRSTGYCVDDTARLAIVSMGLERRLSDPGYRRVLVSSLAFLLHAWHPHAPGMHNFMDYQRRWLDGPCDGDHVGRAAWALGAVIADQPLREEADASQWLLTRLAPCLEAAPYPREVAFGVLGLTRAHPSMLPAPLRKLLRTLADQLAELYDRNRRDEWRWFEPSLTYDNARLPQALIAAGHRLGDAELTRRGLEALDWYAEQCGLHTDVTRLVGNRWRRAAGPDGMPSAADPTEEGDEQPVDAAALVEALTEALVVTGDRAYGDLAVRAFEWFLGRNHAGLPLYDVASGGCHDGLQPHGVNRNEGAESTLAFLQALLALEAVGLSALDPRDA